MFELSLLCPEAQVESISDALEALDALSVSVEDADADTDQEQALFGEPGMPAPRQAWASSRIVALFATQVLGEEARSVLALQDFCADVEWLGLKAVADQDWVRMTQSQFSPIEIAPAFWVVPSWHQAPEGANHVIELDPGLAFGTGTHPTTRMCLRWLALNAAAQLARTGQPQRVLDYGCGSGILAIGAAKVSPVQVDAVDIDPVAVDATLANAQVNHVQLRAGRPELAQGEYGLVVANILAMPLKVLAPLLCGHLAPGGRLILAGILERQADELIEAYAPWVALSVTDSMDGWILMTAERAQRA